MPLLQKDKREWGRTHKTGVAYIIIAWDKHHPQSGCLLANGEQVAQAVDIPQSMQRNYFGTRRIRGEIQAVRKT
jgi:hypothetical protein